MVNALIYIGYLALAATALTVTPTHAEPLNDLAALEHARRTGDYRLMEKRATVGPRATLHKRSVRFRQHQRVAHNNRNWKKVRRRVALGGTAAVAGAALTGLYIHAHHLEKDVEEANARADNAQLLAQTGGTAPYLDPWGNPSWQQWAYDADKQAWHPRS